MSTHAAPPKTPIKFRSGTSPGGALRFLPETHGKSLSAVE